MPLILTVIVVYEWFITFDLEKRYLWNSRISGLMVFFFVNRYFVLAEACMVLSTLFPSQTDRVRFLFFLLMYGVRLNVLLTMRFFTEVRVQCVGSTELYPTNALCRAVV